jgi:hypothetical protein
VWWVCGRGLAVLQSRGLDFDILKYSAGDTGTDPFLGSVSLNNEPDADLGGPKTYGSYGTGCGFGKLVHLHHSSNIKSHKEVTKQ